MAFQPAVFAPHDAVALIVEYLRSSGVEAVQSLYGWDGRAVAQVTRSGGLLEGVLERVDVQIDARAQDADAAHDAMALTRRWLAVAPLRLAGCVRSVEVTGPLWLPEPEPDGSPRFVADWALTLRGI